jgi:hypothetical protein
MGDMKKGNKLITNHESQIFTREKENIRWK